MKNQHTILNHFKNKEYIKAADICRKSLNNDPNNLFYLNMISISYSAADDNLKAAKYIKKAITINPRDRDTSFNYGTIMYKVGNFDEAYKGFNALLNINDKEIRGWMGLGEVLMNKGELARAENMFLQCLQLDERNITALMGLRKIYYQLLKVSLEENIINTFLNFYPDNTDMLIAKISNCIKQNKIEEAQKTYHELKSCSVKRDRFAEDVVQIDLEWANGNKSKAIQLSKKLTANYPMSYTAWNILASKRVVQSDTENAKHSIIKSYLLARTDLENSNVDLRRIFTTIYSYYRMTKNYKVLLNIMKKWVRFRPYDNIPKFYLGETYASMGDYKKGFEYYKYRYGEHKFITTRIEEIKEIDKWDGKINCANLLILTEQGLGDILMHLRVLKEIKNISSFEIYTNPKMVDIIRTYFNIPVHNIDELTSSDDLKTKLDKFDYYIELGDVFEIFFSDNELFNKNSKVIKPNTDRRKYFRSKYCVNEKINIGISWATKMGRGQLTNLNKRDIDLLVNQEGFNIIDLQYPYEGLEHFDGIRKTECVDKYNDITSFVDLMSSVDYVITIDNSAIHFAGALGISSYLLLTKGCDWRWKDEGNSTKWYDTVSIYRQSKANDFSDQILDIIEDIKARYYQKK